MKNRLKELRQLYQWSQSDLARKLGVSRQAINGFESGKFDPSLDMAFKISSLFDVALEEVFTYEAKNKMQTLVERFTNLLGFEFGFERFSETAIASIEFAQNEGLRLDKSQIEPEQILLGLLANDDTTSARLLRDNGMAIDEISQNVEKFRGNLKPSPESKFVMEMALQIVRLQRKKSIETEHLLWGLIRLTETNNTLSKNLFERYNVDLVTLNQQLIKFI
jgi:putative transcriptional regulator